MSKRLLRLVIAGSMFATLFLRWNPSSDRGSYSNLFFILWFSLEALSMMVAEPTIANIVGWLSFVLFLQTIPILILFNVWLSIHPFKRLKRFYRFLLLILIPLAWYQTFTSDPGWRGIGFWAHTLVISGAGLIEVVLVIIEQMKVRNSGQQEDLSFS